MRKSDAKYYRRREAQELTASTMASDPQIGRLHWEIAHRYADLADLAELAEQAKKAPSIQFVPDCWHLPD